VTVDREAAIDIAREACTPPRYAFTVLDGLPDGTNFYSPPQEPYWCIRLEDPMTDRLGPSRLILVSKQTGKVLFSGLVGE